MSTNEKEPETTSPEEVTEAETVPEEEGAKPEKKKLLTAKRIDLAYQMSFSCSPD